eukprot:TRINITY_DN3044_c0_g1_i1.p1 TRINITY_DN3044_c0_g1~~TRINITY_DN3044_c0_g1_i1.p1  ORF type:complete len:417 (+),score=107.77 TRINITY_DN3044_c0_g1_i1:62-1312(+)
MTGAQYVHHSPYAVGDMSVPLTKAVAAPQMTQQPMAAPVISHHPHALMQQPTTTMPLAASPQQQMAPTYQMPQFQATTVPQFYNSPPVVKPAASIAESEEEIEVSTSSSFSAGSTPPMGPVQVQTQICSCGCGQPVFNHNQQFAMPQTLPPMAPQQQPVQIIPQQIQQPATGTIIQQPQVYIPQQPQPQPQHQQPQQHPLPIIMPTVVPLKAPSSAGSSSGSVISATVKPVLKKIAKSGRNTPPVTDLRLVVKFKHGREGAYSSEVMMPIGTHVIVRGDWGQDLGVVAGSCAPDPNEPSPRKRSWVSRTATDDEISEWKQLLIAEESALQYIRQQAQYHNVPITVHRAEYQLDGSKLTFHYTTTVGHPDFRAILRDGYREFRCRIWLNNCIPKDGEKGDVLDLTSGPIPALSVNRI